MSRRTARYPNSEGAEKWRNGALLASAEALCHKIGMRLPLVARTFALTRHFWRNDRYLWPIAEKLNRALGLPRDRHLYRTARGYRMALSAHVWPEGAMLYGIFEVATLRLMHRLVRPGHVVVDVGANIGYHTLTLSRLVGPNGKVLAFEPHPVTRARLEANLAANDCHNVNVFPIALSDREGAGKLFEPTETAAHGQSSLRARGEWRAVDCRTAPLDALLSDLPRLDLIKIDVEGAEGLVLAGAREILQRFRPHVIIERNDEALAAFGTDFNKIAAGLPGYESALIEAPRAFANYHFAPR